MPYSPSQKDIEKQLDRAQVEGSPYMVELSRRRAAEAQERQEAYNRWRENNPYGTEDDFKSHWQGYVNWRNERSDQPGLTWADYEAHKSEQGYWDRLSSGEMRDEANVGGSLTREVEKFFGIDKQRQRNEIAEWLRANPGSTENDYWAWKRNQETQSDADRARAYEQRILDDGPLGGMTAENQFGYQQATIDDLLGYMPSLKDLTVRYEHEDVDAYLPEGSEYSNLDPGTRESQMRALAGMEDIYSSGGMTAADAARMQQAQAETGQWMAAQRAGNQAQSQARGIGGSGGELAGGLASAQQGAQSLGARDLAMQVQAQNRALQAMQGAGNLAGQARQNDMTRAGALDDFNMDMSRERRGRPSEM